ncbi:hypothetical protein BGZ61DRAFT_569182, partial [Ilyonectria robusta]|uniref:uncharacterized protein n=1 Tax=Ilyonectria robusta TaxID=1079257 RepID=UPI001E8ED061
GLFRNHRLQSRGEVAHPGPWRRGYSPSNWKRSRLVGLLQKPPASKWRRSSPSGGLLRKLVAAKVEAKSPIGALVKKSSTFKVEAKSPIRDLGEARKPVAFKVEAKSPIGALVKKSAAFKVEAKQACRASSETTGFKVEAKPPILDLGEEVGRLQSRGEATYRDPRQGDSLPLTQR